MSWAGGDAVSTQALCCIIIVSSLLWGGQYLTGANTTTQKGTLPKIMVGEYNKVGSVFIGGYFRHRMVTFQLLAKRPKSIVLPLLQLLALAPLLLPINTCATCGQWELSDWDSESPWCGRGKNLYMNDDDDNFKCTRNYPEIFDSFSYKKRRFMH